MVKYLIVAALAILIFVYRAWCWEWIKVGWEKLMNLISKKS